MELHNLKPAVNTVKSQKRIARGQGSGHGGTATRGHKGAKSRSGYHIKRNGRGRSENTPALRGRGILTQRQSAA